jgi:hypothetical protein
VPRANITDDLVAYAKVISVFDEPHDPACDDGAADEECEAEGSEADHHAGFGALGDAEDDRGEEREEEDGSEVRDGHERFLPVASECASTAETMFSRPATTINLVP